MESILSILQSRKKQHPLKPHPVPGLLGGMGPESTLDFYRRIFEISVSRGARRDQDHLQVLISILPQTPDRTQAILEQGESPLPYLMESASRLELAGADFLVVICNTAHYYLDDLRQRCNLPILSFEEETLDYLKSRYSTVKRIGLLATRGTYQAGIYRRYLEPEGYQVLIPEPEVDKLMEAIYGPSGIKSVGLTSESQRIIEQVVQASIQQGAELLLLACTEISLALRGHQWPVPVVDTVDVAAHRVVEIALTAWSESGSQHSV